MTKLTLPIEIEAEQLVRDVCENLPEYCPPYFQMTGFHYKNHVFGFYDSEENKSYTLNMENSK